MSASPHARGRRGAQGRRRAWLRRLALASFAAGWLGIIGLVWPLAVHGQANDVSLLSSYGATASGWAIQPYIESDQFSTIPATDQSAPYVYTSIQGDIFPDGSTSETAKAKAAYVTAGTAPNAVLTQAGQAGAPSEQVPDGVEADYPGATGSASSSIGAVSDGVATQACAGGEQAQAAEATAQAYSTLASYRFAPSQLGALPSGCTPPALPGGVPTPPALPTLPPLPTPPALPTLPGGSGATPTATPSAGGGTGATPVPTATRAAPTPTATSCPLIICLGGQPQQAAYQPEVAAHTGASPVPVPLPDVVEQQLATALKAAELANPNLLALAGGKLAAPNLGLPYAAADISAQSAVQASNSGAQATLVVHGGHVELFQGLITFTAIDSTIQGVAPGNNTRGQGTITTTITGAAIAGIPVTIDQNGIQVTTPAGRQGTQEQQGLTAALNNALKSANVQITLAQPTTMSDLGKWQGAGGGLDVVASEDPVPGRVPATHVDFSLGRVTASLYAVPGSPQSSSGDNGGGYYGGGYCPDCYGGGFTSSSSSPGTSGGTGGHAPGGLGDLPYRLTPGELLSLLFIVQGFSTAAVAAAASNADLVTRLSTPIPEEESK